MDGPNEERDKEENPREVTTQSGASILLPRNISGASMVLPKHSVQSSRNQKSRIEHGNRDQKDKTLSTYSFKPPASNASRSRRLSRMSNRSRARKAQPEIQQTEEVLERTALFPELGAAQIPIYPQRALQQQTYYSSLSPDVAQHKSSKNRNMLNPLKNPL